MSVTTHTEGTSDVTPTDVVMVTEDVYRNGGPRSRPPTVLYGSIPPDRLPRTPYTVPRH